MGTRTARLVALLGALLLLLAACGGGAEEATEASEAVSEPLATEPATELETEAEAEVTQPATDVTEDAAAADGTEGGNLEPLAASELRSALEGAGLGSLLAALETAGLTEQLAELPEFTVFAPNDEAFAAITEDLAELDPTQVEDILTYHVVDQRLTTDDLQEGENTVTTLQGSELTVTVEGDQVTVGDGATVTQADLTVGGPGVVHVIDQVLMPGA